MLESQIVSKSEEDKKKITMFPCILIEKQMHPSQTQRIIIATSAFGDYFTGVVVSDTGSGDSVGHKSSTFNSNRFELFQEKLVLENKG